jgi:hypothetical protein
MLPITLRVLAVRHGNIYSCDLVPVPSVADIAIGVTSLQTTEHRVAATGGSAGKFGPAVATSGNNAVAERRGTLPRPAVPSKE